MSSISDRAIATTQRQQSPSFRARIVTDDDMAKALDFLRDSAIHIGAAREAMIKASRLLEHTEALLILASDQTSEQKRKADARTNAKWLAAATQEAEAAGEFEKMKALREAASAKIEAWRSEQANYRGMKI